MPEVSYIAGGSIQPSVFVTLSATADFTVNASASGDYPIGIAQEYCELAQINSAGTYAATTGDAIKVYTAGEVCFLQAPSGTGWAAGQALLPNSLGQGITATTGYFAAKSLEAVSANNLGRVQVQFGYLV